MTVSRLEQAKREAILARQRLDGSLVAVQQRLKPGNLAGEAWDGVKDKSADLADGALDAVKKRPGMVSVAVGALALFIARDPIKRTVSRFLTREEEDGDGRITSRIESDDPKFNLSSPIVDASVNEGVN